MNHWQLSVYLISSLAGVDLITACDIRLCTQDAWFQVKVWGTLTCHTSLAYRFSPESINKSSYMFGYIDSKWSESISWKFLTQTSLCERVDHKGADCERCVTFTVCCSYKPQQWASPSILLQKSVILKQQCSFLLPSQFLKHCIKLQTSDRFMLFANHCAAIYICRLTTPKAIAQSYMTRDSSEWWIQVQILLPLFTCDSGGWYWLGSRCWNSAASP